MGTHSISALFATALVVLSVKMTLLIKSQKLNYYLISEACTVIQDLSLTLDNYKGVVDLLKERFADAQVLISANMDALLSLKIGSSCHDILHLRNIYDAGHVQARNFVPFDIYMDSYGPMLVSVLLNKLLKKEILSVFKQELVSREQLSIISQSSQNNYSGEYLYQFY